MSRVLPNAMVARAFRRLGVRSEALEADLPKMVDVGRQKLYGFQHDDGGWGWWFDDSSHEYQSAYILYGLAMTEQAGFEVDDGVMQRGADFLSQRLLKMDARTRAYALYALASAGQPEPGQAQVLASQVLAGEVGEFDPFSQAALSLSLHLCGDEALARRLVDDLATQAVVGDDEAHWEMGITDGHYREKTMASSLRSTALALDALVQIEPEHPLIVKGVRWLMRQRQGNSWGTTQETSYALLSLADYILSAREKMSQQNWRVDVDGETVGEGSFTGLEQAIQITVPGSRLHAGENSFRLLHGGHGRLYYTVLARIYTAGETIEPAGRIYVSRRYLRPGGKPLNGPLRVGDLVEVQLTVEMPERGSYLILYDPLPAGLEGLNERLGTTSFVARRYWETDPEPGPFPYSRKEVRDGAVILFFNDLAAGRHTFTYLARATIAGTFHALPAEAYLMYRPEVWGRSAGDVVIVHSR